MFHRRRCGFTLIEVLVAITLLAVSAAVFIEAQALSTRNIRKSIDRENALWLARSRLHEVAAFPADPAPEDREADRFEGVDYRTRIEYRDHRLLAETQPTERTKVEIRVIVEWGQTHPPHSLQLTAFR